MALTAIRTPDGRFTQQAVDNLASWGYTHLHPEEKPLPERVRVFSDLRPPREPQPTEPNREAQEAARRHRERLQGIQGGLERYNYANELVRKNLDRAFWRRR